MKKQRLLSLLLVVCMVLSMLPVTALAADAETTVSVSFTAQAYGGFLCPPQHETEVSNLLAETYGYEDGVAPADGVSVLDVLVRAHELTFGDDFAAQPTDYLQVTAGSVTCLFGIETYNCGFTVNHLVPGSDTFTTAKVTDGDFVELFLYQHEYAVDNYLWFVQDGNATYALQAEHGVPMTVGVAGYCVGWYGYQYTSFEEVVAAGTAQEAVEFACVDPETGALTPLEATVNSDGAMQLTFDQAGEYLLTAYAPAEEEIPALLPLATVTVGHSYVDKVTDPTCTEKGYTTHTCACGDSFVDTEVDALGHDWDEGKVTTEPTETQYGVKTYTCKRCGETKTEEVPVAECPSAQFTDVGTGKWYHEAVDFVVANDLMKGISDTTFEPNSPMTRGMLVTILYRAEGEPDVTGIKHPFTDVADRRYFTKPVAWAYDNEIVKGITETTFEPDTKVSREQLATILFRYAEAEAVEEDHLAEFPDVEKVHNYAKTALNWAVAEGLITGNKTGDVVNLDPRESATRAQIATILMRYFQQDTAASDTDAAVAATAGYLLAAVPAPVFGAVGGEWVVFGLSRSAYAVDAAYFEDYYGRLTAYVQEHEGVLSSRRCTEYARAVLALTAMEKDPENVAGYSLIAPLTDFDAVSAQGVNGCIFALLALDCGSYMEDAAGAALRDAYVGFILDRQLEDGGWNINPLETSADPDTTAMALQALAEYTQTADVAEAVAAGVACLSELQTENGGFLDGREETAESAAQVVVAMCALNIAQDDPRFVKNGHTVVENLISFRCAGGSFAHAQGGAKNQIATEQAFCALVALQRMERGETPLYTVR